MTEIILALGANFGDRAKNLTAAVKLLTGKIAVQKVSRWYETAPVGVSNQPDFLNGALSGHTALAAVELLDFCLYIEQILGRVRPAPKWSARVVDLDIIFYGNQIIETERLQVPHPLFAEREFVLTPLVEIAPDFICPRSQKSSAELLMNWQAKNAE